MNIVKGQGWPDFVMLDRIDEASFLKNLQDRFNQRQIYTYIGEQVVAMNPFTKVDIYGQERMKQYVNRYMYEVAPHIYALAEDTFRQLVQQMTNQCVLITGESGAGKTEASKIFMQHIVFISGNRGVGRGMPGGAETIKQVFFSQLFAYNIFFSACWIPTPCWRRLATPRPSEMTIRRGLENTWRFSLMGAAALGEETSLSTCSRRVEW